MKKTIAVVIPAYNAEKFIKDALNSVKQQSYAPSQVIVVNDGSTDKTQEILDTIEGITVVNKENTGIGDSLNAGIAHAYSELISFLDADDVWVKDKLMLQMKEFEKISYSGIVFGQIEQSFHEEIEDELKSRLENPRQFLPGVHRSTMLINRVSFNKVGPFSTDFISEEFLEWYIRAKEQNLDVRIIDQVVAKRRIHGKNITLGSERKMANKFPSILKQALDRRRSNE